MDLLFFERKRGVKDGYERPIIVPSGVYMAVLVGDMVEVRDINSVNDLLDMGCFGNSLERRSPYVSLNCFMKESVKNQIEAEEAAQRKANKWGCQMTVDDILRLGMEEAVYLSADLGVLQVCDPDFQTLNVDTLWKKFFSIYGIQFVRRYAVYRFFRQAGWVVRPGLSFGVDYVLYCDGPDYHHSSIGVRIANSPASVDAALFVALNRGLNNVKKALLVANVDIPMGIDLEKQSCVERITVSHAITLTWRPANL